MPPPTIYRHFGAILGHFGAILAYLEPFWAFWGPFWAILGPFWGQFVKIGAMLASKKNFWDENFFLFLIVLIPHMPL